MLHWSYETSVHCRPPPPQNKTKTLFADLCQSSSPKGSSRDQFYHTSVDNSIWLRTWRAFWLRLGQMSLTTPFSLLLHPLASSSTWYAVFLTSFPSSQVGENPPPRFPIGVYWANYSVVFPVSMLLIFLKKKVS